MSELVSKIMFHLWSTVQLMLLYHFMPSHCMTDSFFFFLVVELESHRDRVSRHSQGLVASVHEQKATIQELVFQQEIEVRRCVCVRVCVCACVCVRVCASV